MATHETSLKLSWVGDRRHALLRRQLLLAHDCANHRLPRAHRGRTGGRLLLRIVGLGHGDFAAEDIVDADASLPFNLLLGALLVLLAHVHDRSGGGAVAFFAVPALVLLEDLVGHAAVLPGPHLLRLEPTCLLRLATKPARAVHHVSLGEFATVTKIMHVDLLVVLVVRELCIGDRAGFVHIRSGSQLRMQHGRSHT